VKLRLPASPVESSLEGRAFVFSGSCVAVLAIVLYGQDYVAPAAGVVATAIGHVVRYRGRARKRGVLGQVLLDGRPITAGPAATTMPPIDWRHVSEPYFRP